MSSFDKLQNQNSSSFEGGDADSVLVQGTAKPSFSQDAFEQGPQTVASAAPKPKSKSSKSSSSSSHKRYAEAQRFQSSTQASRARSRGSLTTSSSSETKKTTTGKVHIKSQVGSVSDCRTVSTAGSHKPLKPGVLRPTSLAPPNAPKAANVANIVTIKSPEASVAGSSRDGSPRSFTAEIQLDLKLNFGDDGGNAETTAEAQIQDVPDDITEEFVPGQGQSTSSSTTKKSSQKPPIDKRKSQSTSSTYKQSTGPPSSSYSQRTFDLCHGPFGSSCQCSSATGSLKSVFESEKDTSTQKTNDNQSEGCNTCKDLTQAMLLDNHFGCSRD